MKTSDQQATADIGLLADNGIDVQCLQTCLSQSETMGNTVPGIIIRLASEGGWREFVFPSNPHQIHRWNAADFRRFIESPRPAGCQTPIHVLERLLRGTEAWATFLELTRGEPGAPAGNQNAAGPEETNCDSITVCLDTPQPPNKPPPTGTSVSYALRRLSREAPDLYERVKAGELTANAAMIQAGLRPAQLTVPLDPRKAGRRLAKHFTREQFSEMVDEMLRIYGPR